MGVCGTGPTENDTAGDVETALFYSEDFEEQRYGAWLLTRLNPSFPYFEKRVRDALNNMHSLLLEKEWIDRWYDPAEAVAAIKKQIEQLEATQHIIELDKKSS